LSSTAARCATWSRRSDCETERSALDRIDGDLLDELAALCKFHEFARLIRVGINGVVVADNQMAVGCLITPMHRFC
jgi:hypothetical protein